MESTIVLSWLGRQQPWEPQNWPSEVLSLGCSPQDLESRSLGFSLKSWGSNSPGDSEVERERGFSLFLGTTDIYSHIGKRKEPEPPGSAEKDMVARKQYIEARVTGGANANLLLWMGSTTQ